MILRNTYSIPTTRKRIWAFLLTAWLLVSGCQNTPEMPTPAPEEILPEAPLKIDVKQLNQLLDAAEVAIADNQLTYPEGASAQYFYQQIIEIEPGQEDALRGLERIVELYIESAMQALDAERFATARSMLARARLINPTHPSIEPTSAQIRLLSGANKKIIKLSQAELATRTPSLSKILAGLAYVPEGKQCRFKISAKNDAQGRWIYEQMSQARDQARLRAQIELRLPAGVERLCFES